MKSLSESIRELEIQLFNVIAKNPIPEEGQLYYLEEINGCGFDRLAILENKIVGTSVAAPMIATADSPIWVKAVYDFLTEKFGINLILMKADWRGCSFQLRDPEDARYFAYFKYHAPSTK